MITLATSHPAREGRRARVFAALSAAWLASALTMAASTTTWTGAVNNVLSEPGNWTDGLPTETVGAIFPATGVQNPAISGSSIHIESFLFPGTSEGEPLSYSITAGGQTQFHNVQSILVEAGSGAHTISPGALLRFKSGQTNYVTNHSDNLLTLNAQLRRSGDATTTLVFDGSGNVLLTGGYSGIGVSTDIHTLRVASTMSGQFTVDAGLDVRPGLIARIYGGVFALDGVFRTDNNFLTVGGQGSLAVLTGHGRIGQQPTETTNSTLTVNINNQGVVAPGRVGETGVLEFVNFDVAFNNGSKLLLDLLNAEDHDQLLFAQIDTTSNNVVPTLVLSGDVELELNLLPDFFAPVDSVFTILSGYDAIDGVFAGLPNGAEISIGDYVFQIHYGTNETTLTVLVSGDEPLPDPDPTPDPVLYWGGRNHGTGARVMGSALDGSDTRVIFDGTVANDEVMQGKVLGLTVTADHIYWIDLGQGNVSQPGAVWRANRDGSGAEIFAGRPAEMSTQNFRPQFVVVDESNGMLYFSEYISGLYAVDLTTREVESLGNPISGTTGLVPFGDNFLLSVNENDDNLRLTNIAEKTHVVVADLSVENGSVAPSNHYGLALDAAGQKLYFTGYEQFQLAVYDFSTDDGDITTGTVTMLVDQEAGVARAYGLSRTGSGKLIYVVDDTAIYSYDPVSDVRESVNFTAGSGERPHVGVAAWDPIGPPSVSPGYDAWAEDRFTDAYGNPAISGPTADPDGDGIPNLLEYALGLDPLTPGVINLNESIQTVGGNDYLTVTFSRPSDIDDMEYNVDVSTDLIDWTPGTGDFVTTTDNGIDTVTYFDDEPVSGQERRFFRLRVEPKE